MAEVASPAAGDHPGTGGLIHPAPVDEASKKKKAMWGRAMTGTWTDSITAFLMMAACPFLPVLFNVTIKQYNGSLVDVITALIVWAQNPNWDVSTWSWLPTVTYRTVALFFGWEAFQFALAVLVPAPTDKGQLTPAGNQLSYVVNGWTAWFITHIGYVAISEAGLGLISGGIIFDEWSGLLMVAQVFGFALTFFAYFKAGAFPSHPEDCKRSGSRLYDLFMGVELNPRFGDWFDFKLFFNGRPGIVGWTLFNVSFAFKQYELYGEVTLSMIALNILHAIYVLDFFWNEGWYLRTIDIAHDHFGFYLAWGDTVWLPFMYTLQGYYLVFYPVKLTVIEFSAIMALGLAGYAIFRGVNDQKDKFRKSNPEKDLIWGRKPRFVRAKFQLADGTPRESLLLASGFWGLSRHFNYVGDLMMSLSFCLCCGFTNLIPYFYIIYMTILLVHRVLRDDARCSAKYGQYWKDYCKMVRWNILPGVW